MSTPTKCSPQILYDIFPADEADIKYISRVPSQDFSVVDKFESDVATLQYIAAHTSVPVPKMLRWSTDPANSAGTKYKTQREGKNHEFITTHVKFDILIPPLFRFRRLSEPHMRY
jgi:hypothetical protein